MKCNYYGSEYTAWNPEISGEELEEERVKEVELSQETLSDIILQIEQEKAHPWSQPELVQEWEAQYHVDESVDSPEQAADYLTEIVDQFYDELAEAREIVPEEGVDLVVLQSS